MSVDKFGTIGFCRVVALVVKHGWWDRFGHCPPPFLAGWSLVFAPPESIETYLHVGFARGPLLHMASWSLCTNSFSVRYWFCQDSDLSLILCIFSYICLHRSCRETTEIQDWKYCGFLSWCEDGGDTYWGLELPGKEKIEKDRSFGCDEKSGSIYLQHLPATCKVNTSNMVKR